MFRLISTVAPTTVLLARCRAIAFILARTRALTGALTLAATLLWSASAFATLTIDSQESASVGHNSTTSPGTSTFNNAAGNLLVVGVCATGGSTAPSIVAVTYDGVALTQVPNSLASYTGVSGVSESCAIYYLQNPATGSNSISISFADAPFEDVIWGAISFDGATMPGNGQNAQDTTGNSGTASVSVPGTASGDFVVSLVSTGGGVNAAISPNSTSWLLNVSQNTGGDNAALGQVGTTGGTLTPSFNFTDAADFWTMSAAEIFASPSLPPGYVVSAASNSPPGNDTNNNACTIAAPCLTIAHVQSLMEANNCSGTPTGLCLAYVRAGTYDISSELSFSSADNGETLSYYPPDGVDTAVLDGGSSLRILTMSNPISNFTVNGLKFQNCTNACIITTTSSGLGTVTITNVECTLTTTIAGGDGASACITLDNGNFTVTHNYVHATRGPCISVMAFNSGENVQGTVVDSNVCIGALTNAGGLSDGGAIYFNQRGPGPNNAGSSTLSNNFICNYGLSSTTNDQIGIYLDDSTSNVAVTGNVLCPPAEGALNSGNANNSAAIFNNGGQNNVATGNIIDLGDSAMLATDDFGTGGIVFEGNVILSKFTGGLQTTSSGTTGFAFFQEGSAANYTIQNNDYWNCASGASSNVFSNGQLLSDTNPLNVNPQITGSDYSIGSGSPIFTDAVAFPGIAGGFGPLGTFSIPANNHSC
jgi:hypothetical protein